MGIFDFIGGIFKPAAKLIDNLHTSDEERLKLQKQMKEIENQLSMKILEYETKLLDAQASVVKAEVMGQAWIQRSWRPITMLTFLVLVVCDSFGLLKFRLAGEAWTLLQIGLGGYVVGRSAEKIIPKFAGGKKKDEEAKG